MTGTETITPYREVSDEELREAAARVRRHEWRERGAMGVAMLIGFGGIAAWIASGVVLAFVLALFLGAAVYKGLAPRGGPLDDPPASVDPEARAMARRISGSGPLGWLASHVLKEVIVTLAVVAGLVGGIFFPGGLLVQSLHQPLGWLYGAGIGAVVGGLVGYFAARALAHKLFGTTHNPFA